MTSNLTMLAVGDLMLGGTKPESLFSLVEPTLGTADVLVGQGESHFTDRSVEKYYVEVPTEIFAGQAAAPANLSTLARAGFDVITLAGNHIWDSGVPGIEDTIIGLRKYGIAVIGAGMNISEARRPAIIERSGTRFGFLDYNCVGPKLTWATPEKPGCAYVHIVSAYELEHPTPGATPTIYTFAEPQSLKMMVDDVVKLKPLCDVLMVCFHKGMGGTSAKLAMYEQQVSYAAIDAGADLILAHHAHLLRGIEFYKGKAIFHGLGHFVLGGMLQRNADPARSRWAVQFHLNRVKDVFGPYIKPDPENPEYPLHRETMQTMIAKCNIRNGIISRVSYLPCSINPEGQPEVLRNDERGRKIFDYIYEITRLAGLNTRYEWEGEEVVIRTDQ